MRERNPTSKVFEPKKTEIHQKHTGTRMIKICYVLGIFLLIGQYYTTVRLTVQYTLRKIENVEARILKRDNN